VESEGLKESDRLSVRFDGIVKIKPLEPDATKKAKEDD
jgi:hypothetical protein